jgi:hypothetical protein
MNDCTWRMSVTRRQTFGSATSVPVVEQDRLEQRISEQCKSLVRFRSSHSGGIQCFQQQVVIVERVIDGELDGVASSGPLRHDG